MDWQDIIKYTTTGNLTPDRTVKKTDQEWKKLLTLEQYQITRQKGTERAFKNEYCESYENGKYACVCCNNLLFDSTLKFDSKSGWPSFTEPIKENAIKYKVDHSNGIKRVEAMCNVCNGHLGHVFPDGPPPTGLRFCINSASIKLH